MAMGHVALLLGGIVALSALLRGLFLSDKSLWLDETFSVWMAQLDGRHFLTVLMAEPYMMLYYVLLHFWLGLGESEFVVRSLSVLFAVATIPMLYALGARLFGARAGLLGALLLAVNAFHIMHAQNTRSYSLLTFLVTTSSLFFVKSIEHPTRRHWVGYVLTSVLGVYSHSYAALVLVAHVASLVFLPRRAVPWKSLVWSLSSIALLLLPLAMLVLMGGAQKYTWIPEAGFFTVLRAFSALAGAGGPPLLVAYLLCCLIALFQAMRGKSSAATAYWPWQYGFLLTWLFVPFILTLAVSVVIPAFSMRYLIICLPPVVLLAAFGIARVRPRWMFVGTIAVVVSLATYGIFKHYTSVREDWRALTRYVISEGKSGDAVLFYLRDGFIAFDYYSRRFNGLPDRPAIVFPPATETDYSMFFTHGVRRVPPSDALLDYLPSRYSRVWLIMTSMWEPSTVGQNIRDSLANHYHMVKRTEFPELAVWLYSHH